MAEIDKNNAYRHTRNYRISQLGLEKSYAFQFVFDFGDDRRFRCKLLRAEDTDAEEPELIHIVGAAPEQYPDNEEE